MIEAVEIDEMDKSLKYILSVNESDANNKNANLNKTKYDANLAICPILSSLVSKAQRHTQQ